MVLKAITHTSAEESVRLEEGPAGFCIGKVAGKTIGTAVPNLMLSPPPPVVVNKKPASRKRPVAAQPEEEAAEEQEDQSDEDIPEIRHEGVEGSGVVSEDRVYKLEDYRKKNRVGIRQTKPVVKQLMSLGGKGWARESLLLVAKDASMELQSGKDPAEVKAWADAQKR